MKRVCLNRLRTEAQHIANLIPDLDQSSAQDLFDTLFRFCQSHQKSESKLNTKECLKLIVSMMIEDIWSNFDSYALASQYVTQRKTTDGVQSPTEQHSSIRK